MTPFQQLQVWMRRASVAQRVMAGIATIVALSLLGWLVAPIGDDGAAVDTAGFDSTDGLTAGTLPEDQLTDAGETPAAGTDGSGGETATTVAGASGTAGPAEGSPGQGAAAKCPPGTDQGATEKEVKVAITIINIAGAAGNDTIGVPTPELQEEQWRMVADSINAGGGAGCRKLVLSFYQVNPINAADAQQKCLQIANDRPFIALDTGSLVAVGASDCIPNQKVPMLAQGLSKEQLRRYYPYYLSTGDLVDGLLRTGVQALKQQGHFGAGKGFGKLGLLYRTCLKEPVDIMRRELSAAGVPGDKIVGFDLGCPAAQQNTPVELQQAAVTFKNAGVTHVTHVGVNDFVTFTKAAAQQRFTPKYILVDSAIAGIQSGTQQPDAENFDGAIAVASSRYGEPTTPGAKPTPGTKRCDDIFAAKGHPPTWKQKVGYGGVVCSLLWELEAMLDNVPQMQRTALVQAMQKIGTFDAAYPFGPVDFSAVPAGSPYGRNFWRNVVYHASCRCFQVPDQAFKPAVA